MAISGLRDTGITGGGTQGFVADQRPKNWREGILLLNPNGMTPITGLTSVMKTRSTDDPEFNWWEKETASRRFTLNGSTPEATLVTASEGDPATWTLGPLDPPSTVPTSGTVLKVNDLLYVEHTGEVVRVTVATAGSNAVQVSRRWGGSPDSTFDPTGAAINPNVFVIGSAFEEGSSKPDSKAYDVVKQYNYTQIFRNNLAATRTAMKTRLRTGEAVREAKREALLYHSIDIERALIFGVRNETSLGSLPQRSTGGIISYIPSGNIKVTGTDTATAGEITMAELEVFMEEAFRTGSQDKMVFCGNQALLAVNQAVRKNATYNIEANVKEFGMNITRITSPFGVLNFKTHPLFNQITSGANGGSDYRSVMSWALVIDMAGIVYRPLRDSDTKFMGDQQDPGDDAMEAGYLTECGLELHHAKNHFLWKGLASGESDA